MEELKPCDCGNTDLILYISNDSGNCTAGCTHCDYYIDEPTKEKAIAAWNKRDLK